MDNIILMTDSYKLSQFKQYPPGTETVYSYIESRGGKYDEVVMFGLQMFLRKYLSKPITQENIDEAGMIAALHGVPFNREGWDYILSEYDGHLPIKISAVPEGTVVGTKNVLVVVENVDPNCFWVTSYFETALLRAVWYPTTVATVAFNIKKVISHFLDKNGTPELLPFKLNDFSPRGATSSEASGIGGSAVLTQFQGTDNLEAIMQLRKYYSAEMAGFSIPASEHSTITSWGADFEIDAYRNMIKQFGKENPLYACVSDSFNIWKALEMWKELENEIIEAGGTLVIRPDSGDPVLTPVKVVERCIELFGCTTNDKGYKVLPDYVRVIQGDGVDQTSIHQILLMLDDKRISADNIAFGMGGALLQKVDRDTQKFAMKCSYAVVNGEGRDVFKDPITDPGKSSKKGRVWLYEGINGKYYTDQFNPMRSDQSMLKTVYDQGYIRNNITLNEVRRNSEVF